MAVAARDTTNDTFLNRLDIIFFFTKKCTRMTEETRKTLKTRKKQTNEKHRQTYKQKRKQKHTKN